MEYHIFINGFLAYISESLIDITYWLRQDFKALRSLCDEEIIKAIKTEQGFIIKYKNNPKVTHITVQKIDLYEKTIIVEDFGEIKFYINNNNKVQWMI